jgi:hypothetical protein
MFLGGVSLQPPARIARPYHWTFIIPGDQVTSGHFVVRWRCKELRTGQEFDRYEFKATVNLIDPSGTVIDRATRRPVGSATVRLLYAPRRNGRFGTPSANAISPQVNPQLTTRTGYFGWDVAPGFWRLRVTAFGYRTLSSPIYEIPPERKNLRLALVRDRSQQARILDVAEGRAGVVRLGARMRQVSGLRLKGRSGRVRSITVRSRRFRTTHGVRLGVSSSTLVTAFPPRSGNMLNRLLAARTVMRYRVEKATFTVRRGRVVGIRLGR